MVFYYIIVFLFGLAFGSFLNVVISRIDKPETIFRGRSRCPQCGKDLKWFDLIPLVSYFLVRGKCRYCQKPISVQYPLVELATGTGFLMLFWEFGLSLSFFISAFFFLILEAIFVLDLLRGIIPNKIVIPAIILALLLDLIVLGFSGISEQRILIFEPTILNIILGGLLGGILFFILALASEEKIMGMGDGKLGVFIGLILGYPLVLVALILAFLFGGGVGILLLASGKKRRRDKISFGPFLALAAFITIIWGKDILFWYLMY